MSTATPTGRATPALVEGEHLGQDEFHRRYEAMPRGVKAELIDGVVEMPSPVGGEHGAAQGALVFWLGCYAAEAPGVVASGETTVVLDDQNEPQPDALLRVRPEYGGRTALDGGIIHGAPELVVEVARATWFLDPGPKHRSYARAGVSEYLVRAFDPDEVQWFRQADGQLVRVPPDPDGLYRSVNFPGLWLDPAALLAGDLRRLREVVASGVTTPEHTEFLAAMEARRVRPGS